MSAEESGQLHDPAGAASYFNNGVQEYLQEEPGRQQPDLVAPGNVGSSQQSGYHNTGEFAGAASNQPLFYNPTELKNHAGQEQYQGHSQHDSQHNEQWNYIPHADPNAQWHHQDMHQQNLAANVQQHAQLHEPSAHMFYQQPGSMNNEFDSPQAVGENVAQFGNGLSNFLQNYPGNIEQADRYAAVSSGGDPHPSLGQFAKNEPNLDEPQPVGHVDQPLPHGEEYRTCGKSVPDIVSYSKDGNILSGQEYTDVVPMQQHQQHSWLETHGTGVSVTQPGSEAHNLQPFENIDCNNLDIARSPSAQEGLDFGRSEPDLAPHSAIHGELVRFEPDRMCPDLGMSCISPHQHSDPGLPGELVPQGGADHEDLDKRSEHSGSRSSSLMGLSVSESSQSGQHSRSSSLICEASSDIQQHHPPEHLHTSLGEPTGTQEPVNIPEEMPTNDNSHQLQAPMEPNGLANVINKEISSPDPTSVSKSSGESVCASVLEQDKIDHRSTDQEKNSTANSSSLSSHSYPAVNQVAQQYAAQPVHFQPNTGTSTMQASFVPENKEDDKISENSSPSDMRMRHKSTEEVDHLVQGGAHPSAFTTVKGRGGATVQNRIMPSPPLWSTEVPALPTNILLTAASPAPISKPVLPATGIPTSIPGPAPLPIVFCSTSQTSVAQPTAVLGSTKQTIASLSTVTDSTPPTTAFVPSVPSLQTVPSQEIPQTAPQPFVAKAMVNVAPPKPLPASALGVQAPPSLEYPPGYPITQPPVPLSLPSGLSSQPQSSSLASYVTQGVANMSLGSERPQMSAAQPANLQQQYPGAQNNAAMPQQGLPPYAQYPEGYAQQGGIHQGRPIPYPQYPPHQGPYAQGHIPERSTSRGPYAGYGNSPYNSYGQPYDPYYSYRYGQTGYRAYYDDYYYRQQEYARRRYSGARRYTDSYQAFYENSRPRSRQGTESPGSSNSEDRPNSRQEQSRDERDNYSSEGYSRRGYDEYGRPIAYDRAHRNSYYSRGYQYDPYQDQEYKRLQQEYYKEYYRSQQNTSRGLSEQNQEPSTNDSSFASNFHHTGGNTPERYNQDMSSISASVDSNYYPFDANQDVSQQVKAEDTSYSTENMEGSSWTQPKVQEAPPPRRTPTKFSLPHILGRFSPGGHLVKVLANAPGEGATATVEIHSIEAMLDHTAESQELRSFPGPLVSNETHKGDVIKFASKKVKSYREDTSAIDKESATLLWELMLLLCRLNGTVVGQDISELILKNHPVLGSEETEEVDTSDVSSSTPTNLKLTHPKKSVDVEKETLRFRELLLFGRKKDALENAIRSGLWGHALLLACKMDQRTHASVMTRFANSLPMNDPLQTLYQLMSNRQPAAVMSCSDVNWGDWRPHLAMILSNLGTNAELDKKSIITLGDSLGSRGLVHASHFCYLMVQLGLGTYSKKSSKMVLIGSSHGLAFNQFATNEAIQQTEVYEFAQHLANKHYTMPNYNAYKFIYACRLAEHGFITEALHYCEVIAKSIIFLPTHYSETLVSQVCQMSDRLKYHDLQYFDGRELTQPQWLKDLEGIQQQIMEGSIQPASNPETPMPWVESFTNLSNLAETEDTESTPSTQYEPLPSHDEQQIPGMDSQGFYQPADFQENQNAPTQYGQDLAPSGGGHFYQPSKQGYAGYEGTDTYGNQHTSTLASMNVDPGASIGSTISEYSSTTTEAEGDTDWTNSNASNFDYYGATTYNATSKNIDTPSTMPSTPSNTITPPESPRTRTLSQSSSNKGSAPTPVAKQKPQHKHSEQNSTVKPKGGGGSWFRGLFSRFGGKNDVHLPDDSDKTIEWDEKKQKWVNKDSDGDDNDGIVAPPPSDSQLSQTSPPSALPATSAASVNKFSKKHVGRNYVDFVKQQSGTVSSIAPPAALFPTIPNSSAPPLNFFMPTPAVSTTNSESQPQVGNPGSQPPTPASEHSDLSPASQQPQFFNPNSYNNGPSTMGQFQGYNNTQVQSQEPPQPVEENGQSNQWDSTASAEPTVPAIPMMFNPQQFSQQSFQPPMMQPSPSTSGPTSRAYRQRRQYPTQK
ncbi:protein transport protein Sec16A-like isoform X2 [Anneissia japonica]|uniref:protein transport protein Sec16A-like isoform X2 n=1 Tax=Anneissia japonica TaxID=1529436 RepID=UPI0014257D9A|nr:protein transport protein Sec16A-like isoform X2 [Anneissia japonica]